MSDDVAHTHNEVDEDFSFDAVPRSKRRGFWRVGFVMLGFTFFSASMSVGAGLGNGVDLTGFLWAVIIGGLIRAPTPERWATSARRRAKVSISWLSGPSAPAAPTSRPR